MIKFNNTPLIKEVLTGNDNFPVSFPWSYTFLIPSNIFEVICGTTIWRLDG